MSRLLPLVLSATLISLTASSTQASVQVSYDFAISTGFLDEYVVTDLDGSGFDLVATAFQTRVFFVPFVGPVAVSNDARVDLDAGGPGGAGLGIVNPPGSVGDDDIEPPPGGFFSSETLLFSFFETGTANPVQVTLDELFFGNVDGNDDFDLLVDGVLVANEQDLFGPGNNPFIPSTPLMGSTFAVRADGFGFGDNFKVLSLQVSTPEPTALLTWSLLGMAIAPLVRRRRS